MFEQTLLAKLCVYASYLPLHCFWLTGCLRRAEVSKISLGYALGLPLSLVIGVPVDAGRQARSCFGLEDEIPHATGTVQLTAVSFDSCTDVLACAECM